MARTTINLYEEVQVTLTPAGEEVLRKFRANLPKLPTDPFPTDEHGWTHFTMMDLMSIFGPVTVPGSGDRHFVLDLIALKPR